MSQPARGTFGLPTGNRPRSMRSIGRCPCAMAPVARNNSAGGCKTSVSENRHVAGETTPSARSVERSPFRDENNVPPGRLASRAGLGGAFGARRRARWSRRTRSQGSRPRETPSLRTASLRKVQKRFLCNNLHFDNQFRCVHWWFCPTGSPRGCAGDRIPLARFEPQTSRKAKRPASRFWLRTKSTRPLTQRS